MDFLVGQGSTTTIGSFTKSDFKLINASPL